MPIKDKLLLDITSGEDPFKVKSLSAKAVFTFSKAIFPKVHDNLSSI
ncbi:MAG: hypothetical protein OXJ52_08475 [Oligoflexia bacterium]|nr:hypothetical protein [Oligoflexia bacterium]